MSWVNEWTDRAPVIRGPLLVLSSIHSWVCGHRSAITCIDSEKARFSGGADKDEAFNRLKECLTTAPFLGMPRDDGTFYLDTGASEKGVGAVSSQEQDGREVVLAYASRTLSKPERNYDVTRRELLAVVFGLKTYLSLIHI